MSSSTRDCKSHPAPLRGGEEVGAHAPAVRGRAALVVGAPIAGAHGRVGAGRHDDVLGVGHTVAVPVTCGPVAFDEVGFGQPVGGGSGPDRARGARAPRRQRRPRRRTGRRWPASCLVRGDVLTSWPNRRKKVLAEASASAIVIDAPTHGDIAQLGERMTGSHEVRGSIPLISTTRNRAAASVAALFHGPTTVGHPLSTGAPCADRPRPCGG